MSPIKKKEGSMSMDVKGYILAYISKKQKLIEDANLDSFDYIKSGYVDSMGIFMFTVEMEEEFGIAFTDDEIASDEFRTIGGLTSIIEKKLCNSTEEL